MPGTSTNLGHVDAALTAFSHAYVQNADSFVAAKVFPYVGVNNASDVYFKIPRGNFFRDDVEVRPMGGRAATTNFQALTDSYVVEEEALEATIDDRERANQTNPFNSERNKVRLLMEQHLIHRERKWASTFFGAGKWGRDVTGVTTAPSASQGIYWNLATGDPITLIDRERGVMKSSTGSRPNTLVLGYDAFVAAKNNPNVLSRIQYTSPAFVTAEMLAKAFELDQVLVADAVYNSAQEGATEALGYIASSKDALLCYAAPNPGLEVPSAGYVIGWNGLIPGGGFSQARVDRFRDERAYSDVFTARVAYTMKQVAADLGIYLSGIVQ